MTCCQSKSISGKDNQVQTVEVKRDTFAYNQLGRIDDNRLLIENDVNLNGKVVVMPPGFTIFAKGGIIRDGMIVGKGTGIEGKKQLFNRVTIQGTWKVPNITTQLFSDLSYENALRDVVALAASEIQNTILIEEGEYKVRANKNADVGLLICSNTDLVLKGTIRLMPNKYKHYFIMRINGENIRVSGNGSIIGDKFTHTGTDGEWGMGIDIRGAVNATVNGLTIKDCWGDCIYVGGRSQNVLIENCTLDNGRRQGISVTKADGVTIRKCEIINVEGKSPQCAIDIEPNKNDSVDHILVENVKVRNCAGGIHAARSKASLWATTPWIGSVTIRNCDVKSNKKYPIRGLRCEYLVIDKCRLYAPAGKSAIIVTSSGDVKLSNNNISVSSDMLLSVKNGLSELVGEGVSYPIDIRKVRMQTVRNNRIVISR